MIVLVLILLSACTAGYITHKNREQSLNQIVYPIAQETRQDLLRALDIVRLDSRKYLTSNYFTDTEDADQYDRYERYIRTDEYYGLLTVIVYDFPQRDRSMEDYMDYLNRGYVSYRTIDDAYPNCWESHYFDGQYYVNICMYGKNDGVNIARTVLEEFISVVTAD